MLLRILSHLHDNPWALTPRALETMLSIAERRTDAELEALAAKHGKPLENTGGQVTMRGSTAVIEVTGPLFRYANLFTAVSGATSYEDLATSFAAAIENPNVSHVLLSIDSPGGEINGLNELAEQVYNAREKKPVWAYVGGMAASGGYWLASAAEKIFVNESAFLGSIGTVATIRDARERMAKEGIRTYEIVSSKSPKKRPDPATDEGHAQIQEMIDAAADLFIGKVAAYRGVTPEKVASDFGQGATWPANRAIAAGMADEYSSFEEVLQKAAPAATVFSFAAISSGGSMADQATATAVNPEQLREEGRQKGLAEGLAQAKTERAEGKKEGCAEERARIASILSAPEAAGRPVLAQEIALTTDLNAEQAGKLLAKAPQETGSGNSLSAAMGRVKNPEVGAGSGEGTNEAQAEAAAILAFVPQQRRAK